MPIIGPDGEPLPHKYPTDRALTLWVIGYDLKHIGQTIHRMLFRPGAFKIIRDLKTGQWRAYDPNDPADTERESEVGLSPPLIPDRMLDKKTTSDGFSWEKKAERSFNICRLANGTEICAYSSKGEPKQGDPVDLIWIDEDIEYARHVQEWQSRLSDRKGRLIWSAFPHTRNDALQRMNERAEEDADNPNPDVQEFRLVFSNNPFIDADEKRKRLKGWTAEEALARDRGEFLTDRVLVYPNFNIGIHGVGIGDTPLDRAIRSNGMQPPREWTNYLAIDPGHTTQAILFLAVPPPEFGDCVVLWNELYLHGKSADELAKQAASLASGRRFEAFIIDSHAARQSYMGMGGHTISRQYSEAFARFSLSSKLTGNSFINGSDNVGGRVMLVRESLGIRNDGSTRIRVIEATTPNLQREFRLYKKKVTRDEISDIPADRNNHLMQSLEYGMSYDPHYSPAMPEEARPSPGIRAYQLWKAGGKKPDSHVQMGPGAYAAAH